MEPKQLLQEQPSRSPAPRTPTFLNTSRRALGAQVLASPVNGTPPGRLQHALAPHTVRQSITPGLQSAMPSVPLPPPPPTVLRSSMSAAPSTPEGSLSFLLPRRPDANERAGTKTGMPDQGPQLATPFRTPGFGRPLMQSRQPGPSQLGQGAVSQKRSSEPAEALIGSTAAGLNSRAPATAQPSAAATATTSATATAAASGMTAPPLAPLPSFGSPSSAGGLGSPAPARRTFSGLMTRGASLLSIAQQQQSRVAAVRQQTPMQRSPALGGGTTAQGAGGVTSRSLDETRNAPHWSAKTTLKTRAKQ